jgi:hypothetical protein
MNFRRLLILDLALLAALVAGIVQLRRSWYEFEATHRVETIQPEREILKSPPAPPTLAVSAEDWTDIATRNPFSFDRTDVAIMNPRPTLPTQPRPVLLGTIFIGSDRMAMLAPGQSGSRGSGPYKVGASIDNWQVVEIRDKSAVVINASGVRETLVINDPRDRLVRSTERTGTGAPAQAVNVLTSPTPAQAPSTTTAAPPPSGPAAQPSSTGQPTGDFLDTPFGRVPRTKP